MLALLGTHMDQDDGMRGDALWVFATLLEIRHGLAILPLHRLE